MASLNELLKAQNKQEEYIATYLLNYSLNNNWGRVEQTQKSLKDCMEYIRGQAKKQAENNVAMIEDSVVYAWAVEFYNSDHKEAKKANETKPADKKEEVQDEQLTLF